MWKNPQYVITVPESQGTKKAYNVTVALMQSLSNERKYNPQWLPIGFAFCKVRRNFQDEWEKVKSALTKLQQLSFSQNIFTTPS